MNQLSAFTRSQGLISGKVKLESFFLQYKEKLFLLDVYVVGELV